MLGTERKITSLRVTTPEALCNKPVVTVAGDVFSQRYKEDPVAGLFFRDANFKTESSGREMLSKLRGWSRELTGMNVFIGYLGDTSDIRSLSDKGINLYCIRPGDDNTVELSKTATENNMVPAYLAPLSDIMSMDDATGFYIAETESSEEIVDAINSGKLLMYMTKDYETVRDGLIQAAEDGTIDSEVLNKAAGYAITARTTLTQLRTEDKEVGAQ